MQQPANHNSKRTAGLTLLAVFAFWPVWPWYWRRITDTAEDAASLLALLFFFIFVCFDKPKAESNAQAYQPKLTIPLLLAGTYAVSYLFLHSLFHAALAFLCLGCLLCQLGRCRLSLGLLLLLFLALPVIPSLQFMLGFPLRSCVAEAASWLLMLSGYTVGVEGVNLVWGTMTVSVDAPCSGIKMLWAGGLLCAILACFYRLSDWETLAFGAVALTAVIVANIVRASALFYLETGLLRGADSLHAGIGLVVFAALVIALIGFAHMWKGKRLWHSIIYS